MSATSGTGSFAERLDALAKRLERLERRVVRLEQPDTPSDVLIGGCLPQEQRRALPAEPEQPRP